MVLINIVGGDGRSVGVEVRVGRGGYGRDFLLFFVVYNFVYFHRECPCFSSPEGFLRTLPFTTPFLLLFVILEQHVYLFCCKKNK